MIKCNSEKKFDKKFQKVSSDQYFTLKILKPFEKTFIPSVQCKSSENSKIKFPAGCFLL